MSPYNLTLEGQRQALSKAVRYALTPNCNPITGAPQLSSDQLRRQLLRVPIIAGNMGDNLLIATTSGQLLIYEIVLWNSSAAPVDMQLFQGPSAGGVLLLPISNFPATTGLTLGFNGSFEQPHFEIDSGQQFVLTLSTAGPVQGMIRYKVANGT
jgi:hypothetical protein